MASAAALMSASVSAVTTSSVTRYAASPADARPALLPGQPLLSPASHRPSSVAAASTSGPCWTTTSRRASSWRPRAVSRPSPCTASRPRSSRTYCTTCTATTPRCVTRLTVEGSVRRVGCSSSQGAPGTPGCPQLPRRQPACVQSPSQRPQETAAEDEGFSSAVTPRAGTAPHREGSGDSTLHRLPSPPLLDKGTPKQGPAQQQQARVSGPSQPAL